MNQEAIVTGTLHADGTLDLDQKPDLLPGRVRITLQPDRSGTQPHGLTEILDDIHRGQQERGFVGRSLEEIDAALREGEEEYEQRMEDARLKDESANR